MRALSPPRWTSSRSRRFLVGDLALDECQVAADAAVPPVARPVGVPVAAQAHARDGLGFGEARHRRACSPCEVKEFDPAVHRAATLPASKDGGEAASRSGLSPE
jgi:hypothetical protein